MEEYSFLFIHCHLFACILICCPHGFFLFCGKWRIPQCIASVSALCTSNTAQTMLWPPQQRAQIELILSTHRKHLSATASQVLRCRTAEPDVVGTGEFTERSCLSVFASCFYGSELLSVFLLVRTLLCRARMSVFMLQHCCRVKEFSQEPPMKEKCWFLWPNAVQTNMAGIPHN